MYAISTRKSVILRICLACLLACWLLPNHVQAGDPLQLKIDGVDGDVLANVQAALTFPPGLVKDDVVDQRWLQRYVRQVPDMARRALEPFGFYAAEIRTDLVSVESGMQRLTVAIEPGPPVRLSLVRIVVEGPGAEVVRRKGWVENFPLKQGEVLHQGLYEAGKAALKRGVQDQGFLDAHYETHEIRIDVEGATAEIDLLLRTGSLYRFGNVSFTGAEQYPEPFLRRYLDFNAGDVFSYASLGQTQLNLLDADRFEEIRLLPDRSAEVGQQIPVTVELTPGPTKRLRPGIGYGTDTGARLSLTFDHLNMFHRGHALNLLLNLSQVRQSVGAAYILPDTANLHDATELRAGYEREDNDTFTTEKLTAEVERLRDFGRGRKGALCVQLFQEKYTIGEETDTARMIVPGVRYSRRRYRDLVRPRKGHQYELEVRGGHQWLGSDTGLVQVLASGNLLLPLPGRLTLFSRVQGAYTVQNEPLREIPASLRFFAGGDQSVRGYAYQSLGPEDDEGEVIGGKHQLVGSMELERALGEKWGLALFYDVGNAFNDFNAMDLKQGAGLGIRRYTPVGPVRLDLARQFGVADPGYRIHLSIGFGW